MNGWINPEKQLPPSGKVVRVLFVFPRFAPHAKWTVDGWYDMRGRRLYGVDYWRNLDGRDKPFWYYPGKDGKPL